MKEENRLELIKISLELTSVMLNKGGFQMHKLESPFDAFEKSVEVVLKQYQSLEDENRCAK